MRPYNNIRQGRHILTPEEYLVCEHCFGVKYYRCGCMCVCECWAKKVVLNMLKGIINGW